MHALGPRNHLNRRRIGCNTAARIAIGGEKDGDRLQLRSCCMCGLASERRLAAGEQEAENGPSSSGPRDRPQRNLLLW